MALTTWKEIAKVLKKHQQTVRNWHYKIKRLPFIKKSPHKQGRVYTTVNDVLRWAKEIGKL